MSKGSLVDALDTLAPERKAMLNRLRRVEGQLRGIQRMIVEDAPCTDILLQLTAARKAMQSACIEILKSYLHQCIYETKKTDIDTMAKLMDGLIDIAPLVQTSCPSCTPPESQEN